MAWMSRVLVAWVGLLLLGAGALHVSAQKLQPSAAQQPAVVVPGAPAAVAAAATPAADAVSPQRALLKQVLHHVS